jgi:hypothetical protein
MAAEDVRKERNPWTSYITVKRMHSQRATADGDTVTDATIGQGPFTYYIAKAFDYDDIVSNAAGSAFVVNIPVPRGSLIKDCMLRVDAAFTLESLADLDIGDSNQADGWADGLDLSAAVTTNPLWHRDASAVYVNKASDISAGATGAQYYTEGGVIVCTVNDAFTTTPPTTGRAIIFLETLSYNEPLNSEWT